MNQLLHRLRAWLLALLRRPARRASPARLPLAPTRLPAPDPLHACASIVIPALNEATHIASVVQFALQDPATAEVIVIDDSSIDDTAALARQAGAQVHTSSMLGKGASMQDGVGLARAALLVYLDGDLSGLRPGLISDLCRPLVQDEADFVKARFGRGGGRVTELTAKPMLKVFFPELGRFEQPLGGLIAARRTLLQALPFENGYGVDVGLLIDAHLAGARLAEVDIGSLQHDSQPLHDLTAMANEVSRVVYDRARGAGRLHMAQIAAMYEHQRQATATLEYALSRRRGRSRLLLLGLDSLLTQPGHDLQALASATGQLAALQALLQQPADGERAARMALLFRFTHRQQFERVAQALPIRPGVIELVNRMRRAGFMVGVLSDSFFLAAEVLRRRVFADFALAHTLQFDGDTCTGQLRINPAFLPRLLPNTAAGSPVPCKSHVLQRLRDDTQHPPVEMVWAVGDADGDMPLLQGADRGFVLDPAASGPAPAIGSSAATGLVRVASFEALLAEVPQARTAQAVATH